MEIKKIQIAKLNLKPDDIIVLKLDDDIELLLSNEIAGIYDTLGKLFPKNKSLILYKADIKVVRNVLPVL